MLLCGVCVCSDNKLYAGAEALAPSLAKLTQLQTLNLSSEWSVCFGALCVHVYLPLCGVWFVCTLSCVCNDLCCFERL